MLYSVSHMHAVQKSEVSYHYTEIQKICYLQSPVGMFWPRKRNNSKLFSTKGITANSRHDFGRQNAAITSYI